MAGLIGAGTLGLALLGVVGFEVAYWDRVAPGVSALGQPLGGLTPAEAEQQVAPLVQAALDRPLQVRYAEHVWDTSARALGLRWSAAEVTRATYQVGRSGNPLQDLADQADALLNGRVVAVDASTDQSALETSIRGFAAQIDRPVHDARVALEPSGEVAFTPSQIGLATDVAGSREGIGKALATNAPAAELVVVETPPAVPDALVLPAREQLERLMAPRADAAAHVTLGYEERRWQLSRPEVVELLAVEGGKAGVPARVVVEDAPLQALLDKVAAEINQEVQDARFAWNGGQLTPIRESRIGRELQQEAAEAHIRDSILAGERAMTLPVAEVGPVVTAEDPEKLGIVTLIERGSTSFAGSQPEKKQNIRVAAERLNGVVVAPGGVFSFNDQIGPTTLEAGFTWGFGILGGADGPQTVPSVAGGICQVATTLFQPVFWAGFPLEERYAHAYWIPAYTSRGVVGLDVTVDADAGLDFRWTNPTNGYVLVEAYTEGDQVHFALYGTKPDWTVKVDPPKIVNKVAPNPTPVRQEEPSLADGRVVQVETAREGFEVLVSRKVLPSDGSEARTLDLWTGYQPSRSVTVVGTGGRPASPPADSTRDTSQPQALSTGQTVP